MCGYLVAEMQAESIAEQTQLCVYQLCVSAQWIKLLPKCTMTTNKELVSLVKVKHF